YVVAPPGSGKTLLGMEMVRRLGTRALVLAPNTAVQQQWLRTAGEFGAAAGVAAADPSAPVACLTYQSLCQLEDPAVALGNVAELGDVHLVGLTATPPDTLTAEEGDLYGALLGPVDFIVPAPALVRDRALAPYQELAWLTRPLDAETAWLAEHDLRFTELVADL